MILFASQRAHAAELAKHLLNIDENDHVSIHEIRGFVAHTLPETLQEAHALSRGTRCKQFLFSLSLNPPEYADVPIEGFEDAIEEIERKLSLIGQPRVTVFHEKNGRRHCHVIWSRIDVERRIAINMAHFKRKLMDVSRLLFLKNGWKLPKGMERGERRAALHLTREEYRQSVRLSEDAQSMKSMIKGCWEYSDTKEAFLRALEERSLLLARGDRRGFVLLDIKGGVYSLTRWLDVGTRELKSRLGAPEKLPTLEQAKDYLMSRMSDNFNRYLADANQRSKDIRQPLVQEIRTIALMQRKAREALIQRQQDRWTEETRIRMARIPRGFRGIWHKATGEYQKIRALNEAETKMSLERDRKELHALIRSHVLERQELQKSVRAYKEEHKVVEFRIRQEIAGFVRTATTPPILQKPSELQFLTRKMAEVESKIVMLSGDIATLQAALESNFLFDDLRGIIRIMIRRALEALQIRDTEEKLQTERGLEKTHAFEEKQILLQQYIRRYAELQARQEEDKRRIEANKQFYAVIMNMGYALNGLPRWQIAVMEPQLEKRLDESAFTANLRQRSNPEVLATISRSHIILNIDPPTAAVNLRASVLEVKEILRRAGMQPNDDTRKITPEKINPIKTSIKFNTQREQP